MAQTDKVVPTPAAEVYTRALLYRSLGVLPPGLLLPALIVIAVGY